MLNDTSFFMPFTGFKPSEKVSKDTLKEGVHKVGNREFYYQGSEKFDVGEYSYRYSFNLAQMEWMILNP
jgi:hypothetical protein